MKSSEITKDIQIDEYSLDKEWVDQPRKYFRYASKLANAKRELDSSKSTLDIVKAELDLAVRQDPESHGLVKFTEAAGTAAIIRSGAYREAVAIVNNNKFTVDIYQAAVVAMDHRKKALEGLVSLQLSNYFSNPKVPEGSEDRMREVKESSKKPQGIRRNKEGG